MGIVDACTGGGFRSGRELTSWTRARTEHSEQEQLLHSNTKLLALQVSLALVLLTDADRAVTDEAAGLYSCSAVQTTIYQGLCHVIPLSCCIKTCSCRAIGGDSARTLLEGRWGGPATKCACTSRRRFLSPIYPRTVLVKG